MMFSRTALRACTHHLQRRTYLTAVPILAINGSRTPMTPAFRTQRRNMATPPPQVNIRFAYRSRMYFPSYSLLTYPASSDLSTERYHALSDATMDSLLESLEELVDGLGSDSYEVEYHVRPSIFYYFSQDANIPVQSGVLTLILGEKGTYVINKQPPNKQIWLSSPLRFVPGLLISKEKLNVRYYHLIQWTKTIRLFTRD